MTVTLHGIGSMATRHLLAQMADTAGLPGIRWRFEAAGGVDAARRVAAGEPFDLVVLASDALDTLAAGGHVIGDTRRAIALSPMAIAMRDDAMPVAIDSADALRSALSHALRIGYSTGPSGVALMALFDRWGMRAALQGRLEQARPGVPVASMIADGSVDIGFQQLSELMNVPRVAVLGAMPPGLEIVTRFSGAVAATSRHRDAARAVLDHLASDAGADLKRRHGLLPAAD